MTGTCRTSTRRGRSARRRSAISSACAALRERATKDQPFFLGVGTYNKLQSKKTKVEAQVSALDAARSYGDAAEMIAKEQGRPDGLDGVAIMTPNDSHYPFAVAVDAAGGAYVIGSTSSGDCE